MVSPVTICPTVPVCVSRRGASAVTSTASTRSPGARAKSTTACCWMFSLMPRRTAFRKPMYSTSTLYSPILMGVKM
jgi:hypothetical protein